jgi:hypothetical protein
MDLPLIEDPNLRKRNSKEQNFGYFSWIFILNVLSPFSWAFEPKKNPFKEMPVRIRSRAGTGKKKKGPVTPT